MSEHGLDRTKAVEDRLEYLEFQVNRLGDKFEKLRKVILEQHQRINPVHEELVNRRYEYDELGSRFETIEEEVSYINSRMDKTVDAARKFLERKNNGIIITLVNGIKEILCRSEEKLKTLWTSIKK
jgi:chromosome segregation ATPase